MAVVDNSVPRAADSSDLDRSTHLHLSNEEPAAAGGGRLTRQDVDHGSSNEESKDFSAKEMSNDGWNEGFNRKRDMQELEDLLSKLNPMAKEFVPPSLAAAFGPNGVLCGAEGFGYPKSFMLQPGYANMKMIRQKNNFSQCKRRMNNRTLMAQQEDVIKRTVYVSDIDQQVVDCRVCGDPNSVLRFAFVEFTDEEGARVALHFSGTMLGFHPVRVLPSKNAISPVNPTFLPRSEDEREMCARTIYCTNIDKKISQAELRIFFKSICGQVPKDIFRKL